MTVKEKLTSCKFWFSVAAFLGSIGVSIAGLNTNNTKIAAVGVICAVLSAAVYSACDAYVDSKIYSACEDVIKEIYEKDEDN